jgi:hypothetical protein
VESVEWGNYVFYPRLVQPERVVVEVGDDHEALRFVLDGGVARGLNEEPRADPAALVGGRRFDGLEAPAAGGDDDAAARRHVFGGRVERDVPGAAARAEERSAVVEPCSRKRAVALLLLTPFLALCDLQLEHRFPELVVAVRVERADLDVAVRARVRLDLLRLGHERDALVELVAALEELLPATCCSSTKRRAPATGRAGKSSSSASSRTRRASNTGASAGTARTASPAPPGAHVRVAPSMRIGGGGSA